MTIHWVGTGLSAIPGLRRLLAGGAPVTVWNRTVEKARDAVGDLATDIRAYSFEALAGAVQKGDTVVSMLPADQHVPLATLCVERGANFVSSSYISDGMAALDDPARQAGVALVNEVGLDPGIDHLMAHELVADYRQIAQKGDTVSFTSYCGGIPKHPNPFRYKFSWSPLGVLRALRSPSRSIRGGEERVADRPWHAIDPYDAPLPTPERFEVYPNRDSTQFVSQYGFDPDWTLRDFVRGTIRLKGWSDAWADVFAEVETLTGPEGEVRLAEMADDFWNNHAYDEGEPDRVVLFVRLRAERGGAAVFDKEWVLDAQGSAEGTAMARLVSIPVAMAVEAVGRGEFAPGVHAAPEDPELVGKWLVEVGGIADHMAKVNHAEGAGPITA
ncbi:saccharopine dehydrogenase NADP-binding domain-containing protein [Paracoccus sp. Z118]|uniref:saccharopine dehydrogenase family protein n=1 Tax=Paracoccus sp. Z118 TaxID=2851017 RepID=UPI001C2C6815|nr:saccharopine dehydrogenase family protein [Paracoccus sp. Z118]MBV0891199.1 saccharopine dehydrogenase NADP-binding domain-containing protein [Paracoccus sp. Z118]